MGMDSYLYQTTKDEKNAFEDFIKSAPEYEKLLSEYEDELTLKYPRFRSANSREDLESLLTKEELAKWDELYNATKYNDESYEIRYWRKPYQLHNYIVNHFLPPNTSDNCERIYLTKENIDDLIRALRNGEIKDDGGYFDEYDVRGAIKTFSNLEWDENTVYYYYSWY